MGEVPIGNTSKYLADLSDLDKQRLFKGRIKKSADFRCASNHLFAVVYDCESTIWRSFECVIEDCHLMAYYVDDSAKPQD